MDQWLKSDGFSGILPNILISRCHLMKREFSWFPDPEHVSSLDYRPSLMHFSSCHDEFTVPRLVTLLFPLGPHLNINEVTERFAGKRTEKKSTQKGGQKDGEGLQ